MRKTSGSSNRRRTPDKKPGGIQRVKKEIKKRFAGMTEQPSAKRPSSAKRPARKPYTYRKRYFDVPTATIQKPASEEGPSNERLQKYMARRGVDSRRKCEELILEGRVKVNGTTVTKLGTKIDPAIDKITINNKPLPTKVQRHYLAINKPAGYITACSDQHQSKIVVDLFPPNFLKAGVVPIGRLDKTTSGLLLFSNDGEMVFRLTHPKYSVWKTYRVSVKGNPTGTEYRKLEQGVNIDGSLTAPAKAKEIKKSKGRSVMLLSIHEGRNRQVKKMCKTIGHPVLELFRTKIGPITVGRLKPGEYRKLTEAEVANLKKAVGLK